MLLSRLLFHMFQSFSCVSAFFTKWYPVVIFSSFWSQPVEKNVLVCMCTPTFWFIDLWDTGPSPRAFEPARLKTRPYSWLDEHISTCKGCTLRLVASAFSGTQDGRSSVNCSVQFSCSVMSDSATPWTAACPGFTVHHQLPELTQTHVHCIGEAIQPSHPLLSLSPPAFDHFQHQIFQRVSSLHQVAQVLEFQPFQWIFRVDFL